MENLTVGVIGMAVILLVVVIYLSIQWIDESEFKSNLDYLEREVDDQRTETVEFSVQVSKEFESLNKRIEKLEKETKVSTVDRKDIFSNEYYERANRQALDIAKYTEFLARENSKEMIDRLEAIPYLFRTDTEDNLIKNYHYFNQKK